MATNEELVAAIQNGEQDKLELLWNQVERFVQKQAYRRNALMGGFGGTTSEDLYQSGYIALVAAVDTYDPDRGMAFIGWLDMALKSVFAEVGGYRSRRQASDPIHSAGSLDSPLSNDMEDVSIADTISDPTATQEFENVEAYIWSEQLREPIERMLNRLPPQQKEVIVARFYREHTRAEVAERIGVTIDSVRKLEDKAMRVLRKPENNRELLRFVERHTPYYHHVGVSRFHATNTSAVEWAVLERERLFQRWIELEDNKYGT